MFIKNQEQYSIIKCKTLAVLVLSDLSRFSFYGLPAVVSPLFISIVCYRLLFIDSSRKGIWCLAFQSHARNLTFLNYLTEFCDGKKMDQWWRLVLTWNQVKSQDFIQTVLCSWNKINTMIAINNKWQMSLASYNHGYSFAKRTYFSFY